MALPSHERLDNVVDKCLSLSRYDDYLVMPASLHSTMLRSEEMFLSL